MKQISILLNLKKTISNNKIIFNNKVHKLTKFVTFLPFSKLRLKLFETKYWNDIILQITVSLCHEVCKLLCHEV